VVRFEVAIEAVSKEAAVAALQSQKTLMELILEQYDEDSFISSSRGATGNGYLVVVNGETYKKGQ
jgi:hypothetical protein